jgi:predicted membrane GTPase involved in stress response
MHFDMPIEQLVRRADTRFQLGFAHEARELVGEADEFRLHPSREGLCVLGRTEDALERPIGVLKDVYASKLEIEPPRIRVIRDGQVKEPVMHLRISLQTRFLDAVARAMLGRGCVPSEEYAHGKHCVLRYEAPLAELLGLPEELRRITGGTAEHRMALSHYALVTRDPGGNAA